MTITKMSCQLVFVLLAGLHAFAFSAPLPGSREAQETARQDISASQHGRVLTAGDPVNGLLEGRRIDKEPLATLSKDLAEGSPGMRENIVRFLEAAALHANSPATRKVRVIRDRAVVRTL